MRSLLVLLFIMIATPTWASVPNNAALDAFTNSDGTALPTHNANWSNCVIFGASSSAFTIQDNAISVSDSSENDACWATTFAANSEVYVTSTVDIVQDFVGVWLRLANVGASTTDGYGVEMDFDNDKINLWRIDNGVATKLGADISRVTTFGDSIMARMIGSELCALHKTATGGWMIAGCRNDTTYTAGGQIGITQTGGNVAQGSNDDFGGGNLPTGGWREDHTSVGATAGSTTTVSTSFVTLPTNGSTVFVCFGAFNAGGGALTPTFADNQGAGNTYTIDVLNYDSASTGHGAWLARCSNCVVTGGTFTVTVSGLNAASYLGAVAMSFVGGKAASPERTQNARGNSVTADTAAAAGATSVAGDLFLQCGDYNEPLTSIIQMVANSAPASGWTTIGQNLATNQGFDFNYVVGTATVTPRYVQTIAPSGTWNTVIAAYLPTIGVPSGRSMMGVGP